MYLGAIKGVQVLVFRHSESPFVDSVAVGLGGHFPTPHLSVPFAYTPAFSPLFLFNWNLQTSSYFYGHSAYLTPSVERPISIHRRVSGWHLNPNRAVSPELPTFHLNSAPFIGPETNGGAGDCTNLFVFHEGSLSDSTLGE